MAGSRVLTHVSLFGSTRWVSGMGTLSKKEAVFVLTGVAIALAIRTRTDAMDFIAHDALSLGTEEGLAGSLFDD